MFTNEEGMVSSIDLLAPLGNGIVSFQLHCYTFANASNSVRRNYDRGRYDELRTSYKDKLPLTGIRY